MKPRRLVAAIGALALGVLLWAGGCSGSSSSGCQEYRNGHCAWSPCTSSVAEACASGSLHCPMTWPADVTAFCSSFPGADFYSAAANCGAYHAFEGTFVEGSTSFYYSAQTGKLVAVVQLNGQAQTSSCLGGPSDFVDPNCEYNAYSNFTCSDAGP